MKPHKWAKEIKAWADGAEIEFRTKLYDSWGRWVGDNNPDWDADSDWEYRIKPTPKEPQYLYVYKGGLGDAIALNQYYPDSGYVNTKDFMCIGKIKLEQDDE